MKEQSSNVIVIEKPTADLLPISTLASQLMEDVQHIYGAKVATSDSLKFHPPSAGKNANAGRPINAELVVIATRSKQLREEILLRLSYHIAVTNNENVAIYSAYDSYIQFTRKLVGVIGDIPSDAAIYDGTLNSAELKRLTFALTELMAATIYRYPNPYILFNWLRFTTHKLMKQTGDMGLVLVDGVQYLIDEQRHCVSAQQSLMELKGLAELMRIPVVALYQLDPRIENRPTTLTRDELREVETLAKLTDGFVLMSGTPDELVFEPPMIPNAKPVAWLDQISSFSWNKRN